MATARIIFIINGTPYTATEVRNQSASYLITETGLFAVNSGIMLYIYEGEGTFLGFSTTEGSTTPDEGRAVGDTISFQVTGALEIGLGYSVAVTQENPKISIGNLPIANMYFGTHQVKKVYLGNTLVWEKATQSFSTIHLCGVYETDGYTDYAINSSSPQTISRANNASVSRTNMTFALAQQYSLTLSDVSSLKIRYFDDYKIYAPDGSVIADWGSTMPSSIDSDNFYEFISALSEGCYVCVYYND